MAEITIANAVNLAIIIIFISVLIKMFEKVSRRSQIRMIDTSNLIIQQIKTFVIEFNLKKDLEIQQDAFDHQKMQNERKLQQLPGVRRSQVTTSQSNVNMNNPTRLESRMEKNTIDIEGQQNNIQTPKNKNTKRNIEDIDNCPVEMNSKIKQMNMQTPPRPTARKIDQQNNNSTITSDSVAFNSNTLWRQLFFKSVRRFHSLGSMINYFYASRKYRHLIQKGDQLYCGNPNYDLDIISHIFQYVCYFIYALFFAVCIYNANTQTTYTASICVVFILTLLLNLVFLYLDFKYQKVQVADLQGSVEQQAWEQIAIQQDKFNQEASNNNQAHVIIDHNPINNPIQSKRNIPQPPSKNMPQSSRRGDWKRPNSGVSTYPINNGENINNSINANMQVVGAEDSNNNVQQSQLGNKNNIGASFQNQSSNNNHTTQLNRDSSKSSGVHSIGQPVVESNDRVIQTNENITSFDIKDEVQILLEERVNSKSQNLHGGIFLLTVLLGGIGGYLIFNCTEMIGGNVILTCFFVGLADFILRFIICGAISAAQLLRYKLTNNLEFRKEINEEINWVLTQMNRFEEQCAQQENEFKSPQKNNQMIASVKSPSKSVKKIMESLKKIVSPSKKRHQNSPMKDIDLQQDEIQFLPNYNKENIPIKHLIFNQDGKNGLDFDTQTQHDYSISINNVSVNPIMQRINLIKKGNNNQSQDSIDIPEEIAIKKINMTPASQVKNQQSNKKEQQNPRVKEFALDSHRNPHIKIYSDRNQNSLRQDSSKNGVNFEDSADTYIDSINLQPEPVKEKNKKKNINSRRSSIGQIAPLPSSIVYNYNNTVNQSISHNEGEIHSGSLCGKKKSQRSNRSKKDFHTSLEYQNKEFASKNKMLLESTQNDLRSEENIDNSMKPFKAAIEQGYRDSSFLHNRSVNGCDQSHLYTAGDNTQMNDQSNILLNNMKNDGSLILGEINQGMQSYVNNTILDPNDSINAFRQPTWDKNSTIDNNQNTIQPPSSSENRYIKDSKDRLSAIQTRNIQQQMALKQRREQQLKNKSIQETNKKRTKSEHTRLSTSQNGEIHIDNQNQNTLEKHKIDFNDSLDLQNKKISLSVGNFYESPRSKENTFANKLHKESAINNLISQPQQNQLSYANSLSFLHNQTQNDGTMIMQQQQKDLSIYFNNISDNDNSVQVHPTSPERRKITMKKPLSPIPPTDLKDNNESEINEDKNNLRKKIFDTDGDEDQSVSKVVGNQNTNQKNNLLHPYYNVQQIKSFDMNTSEQSFSNNISGQLSVNQPDRNHSVLNNIEINEKNLQSKSLSNGKIMRSILDQNKNKENYNLRSYDFENKSGQGQLQSSNPGSRKNSSQPTVPLKNIVKKKDWEKYQNNSPYLEFLPQMLNGQKDELKEKEKELKSKIEKNKKNSRKGSTELSDKIKKVIDNYGYEVQKAEQKNVLVSKKSSRSVRSQESKRTLDHKFNEEKDEENQKSILNDNTNNILNDSTNNGLAYSGNTNNDFYNNNNQQKKSYPHQAHQLIKSKKPPLSSQNNIHHKNLMLKENYQQNYPNSARVNLNSIALRQTTTMEGNDMSTMEHNIATQSNHDGFFDRNNQDFVLVRPNNQNSIQFDVANSDRQHNKSDYNDEFDFDTHFQQYKDHDNSLSSFDHSHFANPRSNKHNN